MKNKERLIYANEFINLLENTVYDTPTDFGYSPGLVKTVLEQTKTVDAVEVVRCKDCTRYKKGYCTIRKDGWGATLMVGMTDFCSDGERKDNEQT